MRFFAYLHQDLLGWTQTELAIRSGVSAPHISLLENNRGDSVETLAKNGISPIVAPGGAKKDPDAIAAADQHNVALLFVEDRHFRH